MTRDLTIDGMVNVRDLGGLTTRAGVPTRQRAVIRGDAPTRISEAGRLDLVNYGVRQVIDLRYAYERAAAPNPLECDARFRVHAVPLEAPADVVRSGPRGLVPFYRHLLDDAAPAFAAVMQAVLADDGGVLIHCRVGKDRTGVVAALMLDLAGVPHHEIVADYALTRQRIGPLIGELMDDRPVGLSPAAYMPQLDSPAEVMEQTLAHLVRHHGTAQQYLGRAGLSAAALARLRARLMP